MPSVLKQFDLSGRLALVTGSSAGIGLALAQGLAGAGAAVVLNGRRAHKLDEAAAALRAQGATVHAMPFDVGDAAAVAAAVARIEAEIGEVDILINNAGMNIEARAVDLPETEYDRMMDTNVKGAFLMAQQAAKRMIARKAPGRIVNIASIGAFTVLPGLAVYCMSKAAIAMMTRALAREWATRQINVTGICPGYIATELNADWFGSEGGQKQIAGFPRRRLGVEADLDGTLLLLCSDAGRIMTGTLVTVDDGQSL